jgi:hypothetical protein
MARLAQTKRLIAAERNANTRVHETGMTGVDPRAGINESVTANQRMVQAVGSTTTLKVTAVTTDRSVSYLAMGIVLKAIKNGSLSAQQSTEYPYWQFRYLVDVFTSIMLTGVVKLTVAPRWFWNLCYSLKPKVAPCKNGHADYIWKIQTTGQTNDEAFSLGASIDEYTLFWGTFPSGNEVDGFPVLAPIPTPYTDEAGLSSMSGLWPFVTPSGEELIADPGPEGVLTSKDTSAFSVVYPELGESFNAPGASRTTIYSERKIDCPMLAQFGQYQPNGTQFWRGWHKSRLGGGSSSSIGPYLIDNASSLDQVFNKPAPVFKFYNFDEIFEQLSLTMCLASENLEASAGQTVPVCPLTSQQVQLILRQALLQVFSNEYAQDLRLVGASFVDVLPFVVGPNGTNSGATFNMLLPTFLAENIRAMKTHTASLSKKFKTNNITWLPILGRPVEAAQLGNYQYGPNNNLLYRVEPNETPINLIDVSATFNSSTVYLDLTRESIKLLLNHWNEWITKMTAVLSPLVSITSEPGISALNCNMYTNIQEELDPIPDPIPPLANASVKRKSVEMPRSIGLDLSGLRKKLGASPVAGSSYFKDVGERRICSNVGFDSALEQIMSRWILPINYSVNNLDDASTQGWQTFEVEFASKPRTSAGGVGPGGGSIAFRVPDAQQRHLDAAEIDVKAFASTAGQSEIIAALVELARIGRGGFFTSAISQIVGSFNPLLGRVVKTVGDTIGI